MDSSLNGQLLRPCRVCGFNGGNLGRWNSYGWSSGNGLPDSRWDRINLDHAASSRGHAVYGFDGWKAIGYLRQLAVPTFLPPVAFTNPAFLPDTKDVEFSLAKYRNVLAQGVTVYGLSDGSFVQDYPTPENSSTSIPPYPLMPDQGPNFPNIINVDYTGATPGNPVTRQTTTITPYVTQVYYGGHEYPISAATAAILTAYTAHGTGYGDCITS